MRQYWPALSVPCPPHHQPLHVKPWAANPAQEKLLASEEKVVELQQQLQRMRLEQETLAQRNALLERLLAMQQQAQQQTPTETGKRAAIEGQKDAWWLDKQMKVGLDDMRLQAQRLPLHTLRRVQYRRYHAQQSCRQSPMWLLFQLPVSRGEPCRQLDSVGPLHIMSSSC